MVEHRTPRAHLQSSASEDDNTDVPSVSPALVEYLQRRFPIELSPPKFDANPTYRDQAERRGRQEVIDFLDNLSKKA